MDKTMDKTMTKLVKKLGRFSGVHFPDQVWKILPSLEIALRNAKVSNWLNLYKFHLGLHDHMARRVQTASIPLRFLEIAS
jgi:hypothetical protein